MEINDMQIVEGQAYQNDWLEVKTFSQNEEGSCKKEEGFFLKLYKKFKNSFPKKDGQKQEAVCGEESCGQKCIKNNVVSRVWSKIFKPIACVAVICLVFAGVAVIDNGFASEVFGFAKDTYTSVIVGDENGSQHKNKVVVSSNAAISVVDGDVMLTGGSIAVNFLQGTVTDVTDTSVTVSTNDGMDIVYSNLNEVLVSKDDVLSPYHAVGRYDQNAVINIVQDGKKVTDVMAEGYTLSW